MTWICFLVCQILFGRVKKVEYFPLEVLSSRGKNWLRIPQINLKLSPSVIIMYIPKAVEIFWRT